MRLIIVKTVNNEKALGQALCYTIQSEGWQHNQKGSQKLPAHDKNTADDTTAAVVVQQDVVVLVRMNIIVGTCRCNGSMSYSILHFTQASSSVFT